ncbi:AMP-binding protein [Streptomyces sp. NPDC051320]|uniref:class I adenylate-forming enzyme family protein n=1 Tax=Streptomyces sp. NPDC051320 TaxID=3154644 RepID=UPI00341BFBBE
MIIAELIQRSCRTHAEATAIRLGDASLTYAQLWDRSARLANGLRALGLEPGDRVATLGPNTLTSLEEMTGLAVGGYARTALHPMNAGDGHAYMLANAGARALITHADLYEKFAADFASVPGLDHVIVHGGGPHDYERLLADASPDAPAVRVDGDDILHLAYSSGASGRPKASVHSHRSWMHVTTDNVAMLPRITGQDVYLAAAPLSHAASTVLYALLARGASTVAMPSFEPGEALRLIERHRCSITVMVPTMLQMLIDHPDASTRDLSSLRALLYAGSPISATTARAAQLELGNVLFQSYGQSECLPATSLTPEDHARAVAGEEPLLRSAGRACLNSSVRIVDSEDQELGPGGTGEILIRTEGRMRGIFGDPEATAERITPDGFVRTGDVGHLDERGYLFVTDRKDDMIISGGFNIWPAEIEKALTAHPAVADAVVVGVPHPKWGQTPHAVVMLRDGGKATVEELIEHCRASIGSMKKPASVVFRDSPLPRTALGKLQRRVLRDEYWPSGTSAEGKQDATTKDGAS